MKTHQKSDPKMEPKSIKNHSKIDAKKGIEKSKIDPSGLLSRLILNAHIEPVRKLQTKRLYKQKNKNNS